MWTADFGEFKRVPAIEKHSPRPMPMLGKKIPQKFVVYKLLRIFPQDGYSPLGPTFGIGVFKFKCRQLHLATTAGINPQFDIRRSFGDFSFADLGFD